MSTNDALPARGRGSTTWIVAGLAVVVIAVAAYYFWPRNPEHVLIVGDSVSFMTAPELEHEFSGSDAEIIAIPGFTSSDLLGLAVHAIDERAKAGKELDRAIFLVGYNDVWKDQPDNPDLNRMVAASARYRCAIWLTLPGRPGGKPPAAAKFDPRRYDVWNARVTKLVGEHRQLHLVTEWSETVDGAPAGRYLNPDGIHPNHEGSKTLARIMHDSLISKCRFAG